MEEVHKESHELTYKINGQCIKNYVNNRKNKMDV